MNRAMKWMNHGTAILGMMFLVFLVLDQFNPMMNFTDNAISRWLLAALCLGAVARSILGWRQESSGPFPFRPSPIPNQKPYD